MRGRVNTVGHVSGDFNARSLVWWMKDKTKIEGTQLESLAIVHGFHQL